MTEPIEKWREEFKEIIVINGFYGKSEIIENSDKSRFLNNTLNVLWSGFLMAKSSRAIVELPKKYWVTEYDSEESDYAYACNEIHNSLTAAGIPYKIKGE